MSKNLVPLVQLLGAILFSVGSACFVWMAWADEWVLPLRLGCALWIAGCVPYVFLALRSELLREATELGDHLSVALQIGGMLGWAIGSAFSFLDDLDFGLQVTNGGFLAGSACLFLDALLQARALPRAERDEQASLLADLIAGVFYVLAGGFGGYAVESVALMQFGNVCWLAGSLVSAVRPCLALSAGARRAAAPPTRAAAPAPAQELQDVQVKA